MSSWMWMGKRFFSHIIQSYYHRFSYQNTCCTYMFAIGWMFNTQIAYKWCLIINLRRTKHDFVCGFFDVTHQFNHFSSFSSKNFQYKSNEFHKKFKLIALNLTIKCDWHLDGTITIK